MKHQLSANVSSLIYSSRLCVLSVLSCLILLSIIVCGCRTPSPTRQSLEYAERFDNSRRRYRERLKTITEAISESVTGLLKDIPRSEDSPSMDELAERWYEKWTSINAEIAQLKEDLEAEAIASHEYIRELDRLALAIRDPQLKEELAETNRRSKIEWDEQLRNTSATIAQLSSLQTKAADVYRLIVSLAMRDRLAKSVRELRAIELRANLILSELEQLIDAGHYLAD